MRILRRAATRGTGKNRDRTRRSRVPVGRAAGRMAVLLAVAAIGAGGVGVAPALADHGGADHATLISTTDGEPSFSPSSGMRNYDLGEIGYIQREWFVAGTATAVLSQEPTPVVAPYRTRFVLYRPADATKWNGTVYAEWFNVTGGRGDSAAVWKYGHVEMMRQGAAWIGISAQLLGVIGTRNDQPERYATLAHPGDAFAPDIFSQVGQVIRDRPDDVLGNLVVGPFRDDWKMIAVGQSQSAGQMATYINALHDLHHVFDGYVLVSGGVGGVEPIDAPVFAFQMEGDVSQNSRQPDTDRFRLWEVAGAAHADHYLMATSLDDTGQKGWAETLNFGNMLNPTNIARGQSCPAPLNSGAAHWAFMRALGYTDEWVRDGTPPPVAPRLELPLNEHRDDNGNALGGIRTPHVDAAVATLSGEAVFGVGSPPPPHPFCILFGSTTPLPQERLAELYGDQAGFLCAWDDAADDAVRNGFLYAWHGEEFKQAARRFPLLPGGGDDPPASTSTAACASATAADDSPPEDAAIVDDEAVRPAPDPLPTTGSGGVLPALALLLAGLAVSLRPRSTRA